MTELLTLEEEMSLIAAAQSGDEQARHELILKNQGLCRKAAHKSIRPNWMELDDLILEGNLGLANAIDKFDVNKGYRFSTYAYWWIRQSIRRCIEKTFHNVHTPGYVFGRIGQLEKSKRRLADSLGHDPTAEEVASDTGLPLDQIKLLQQTSTPILSLQAGVGGDDEDGTLMDVLVDSSDVERDTVESVWLQECLSTLPDDIQELVVLHYGLNGQRPLTLQEIAIRKNVSKEPVRRKIKKGLKLIRLGVESDEEARPY